MMVRNSFGMKPSLDPQSLRIVAELEEVDNFSIFVTLVSALLKGYQVEEANKEKETKDA